MIYYFTAHTMSARVDNQVFRVLGMYNLVFLSKIIHFTMKISQLFTG